MNYVDQAQKHIHLISEQGIKLENAINANAITENAIMILIR